MIDEAANEESSDPDIFEHHNDRNTSRKSSYDKSRDGDLKEMRSRKDYKTDVPTMGTEQFTKNKVPEFKDVQVKSKLEAGRVDNLLNNNNNAQGTGNSQSRIEKQTADRRIRGQDGDEDVKSESDFGDIEFADASDGEE